MATPSWQIDLGGDYFNPESGNWEHQTRIADWAKPYVHPDGSYKSYQELKAEGLWDLNNPMLLRYFDALSNTGSSAMRASGAAGDWRTSPNAQVTLFGRLGLSTADVLRQPGLGFSDPREAFGDLFNYNAVESARAEQVQNAEESGGLGGILETAGDFVEDVAPLVAAAVATYFGVNALGGLAGAAAPAVGPGASLGTAEAAAAAEAATTAAAGGGTAATAGGGLASLTGPATGTIEAAPVITGGGAPTVTGVATGGGAFTVPYSAGGLNVGGASTGATAAPAVTDVAPGGAMDMTGAVSYPGGTGTGMGAGTIFENAAQPNWLESLLGLEAGALSLAPGSGAPTTALERLIAAGLPAALGYIGSDQQADALQALADRQFAVGAPSRERFEASFAPGFDVGSLPGVQSSMDVATETLLRKLSASGGNPWGNPGGLTEAMNYVTGNVALPALNEYRRLNAGTGGLAALTSGAPQTATASIGADANRWNAIGAGAADFFYPPKRVSLSDILKAGLS